MGGDDGAKKLTHQRKNQIKQLLLAKAREDLKLEQQQKAEEKKAALASRLEPLDDLNSLSQGDLMDLCRSLHAKLEKVDEATYDTGKKVEKNDTEIEELNQKIFDLRGKFKRPPLRRVKMSADQMLKALLGSKHKVSMDLRSNLKSVKKEAPRKSRPRTGERTLKLKPVWEVRWPSSKTKSKHHSSTAINILTAAVHAQVWFPMGLRSH